MRSRKKAPMVNQINQNLKSKSKKGVLATSYLSHQESLDNLICYSDWVWPNEVILGGGSSRCQGVQRWRFQKWKSIIVLKVSLCSLCLTFSNTIKFYGRFEVWIPDRGVLQLVSLEKELRWLRNSTLKIIFDPQNDLPNLKMIYQPAWNDLPNEK
jgi:hypothetical protein